MDDGFRVFVIFIFNHQPNKAAGGEFANSTLKIGAIHPRMDTFLLQEVMKHLGFEGV